ncbi:MAG: histidine phosphatase family protein [Solirubrobacteraceae bacterium]
MGEPGANGTAGLGGVLVARHGETDDNVVPRFQGWRDTPLNETGRRQAFALGRRLAEREQPIASLWASDLRRARETAEIAGAAIGLRPVLDWRLREGDRGRWEGALMDDVERAEPELYAAWMRDDPSFRFPGGESLRDQQVRVLSSLHDIHARGPLPALAVCHGGCIRVVLALTDPRGLEAFHSFDVPNTAVQSL